VALSKAVAQYFHLTGSLWPGKVYTYCVCVCVCLCVYALAVINVFERQRNTLALHRSALVSKGGYVIEVRMLM
jgi:hypothetical protein